MNDLICLNLVLSSIAIQPSTQQEMCFKMTWVLYYLSLPQTSSSGQTYVTGIATYAELCNTHEHLKHLLCDWPSVRALAAAVLVELTNSWAFFNDAVATNISISYGFNNNDLHSIDF